MISEKLQKAREFEQEQLSKISPEERPSFHVTVVQAGSMIQTDFLITMENTICFISTIHILMNGVRCTGDISAAKICLHGKDFR